MVFGQALGSGGPGRVSDGGARRLPTGGKQSGHVAQADAMREARQHVREVFDRVHLDERAAAEHRVGDGRALGAGVTAREQEVLPRESGPDVEPLDDTVVDGHASVLEEAAQRELVVEEVGCWTS